MTEDAYAQAVTLKTKIAKIEGIIATIAKIQAALVADPKTEVEICMGTVKVKIPRLIVDNIITTVLDRYNTQMTTAQASFNAL